VTRIHKIGLVVLAALAVAGIAVQGVGADTGSTTIEVRKVLVPATDPGKFNLFVRYTGGAFITEVFDVGDGGHTARVEIPPGQALTVEESHGTNSSLSNYDSTVDCYVKSGPDAGYVFPTVIGHGRPLTATAGDNYTCTITNTRKSSG
jgi:trimeric autotransporter adhesin